jgi:hypothetical protein
MQNNTIKKIRPNFYKTFKRKVFFSNELKKSIFLSFLVAKKRKTYVDLNGLIYGMLSQPNSLSSRLFLDIIFLSRKTNALTLSQFTTKILELSQQKTVETLPTSTGRSIQTIIKEQELPYFTPEVKEILKNSVRSSLKSKNKISIITTKDVFFELIGRESIRDLLYQVAN